MNVMKDIQKGNTAAIHLMCVRLGPFGDIFVRNMITQLRIIMKNALLKSEVI